MNNILDLSIIIISYNTKLLTINCIKSVIKNLEIQSKLNYEIIIIDNASHDGSVSALKMLKNKKINLVVNKTNLGYGKANNIAAKKAQGRYILLLNSDTIIKSVDFNNLIIHLDKNPDIGGLTVKVNFPNGNIDPASHRGFPTIWRSFCFFSGLEQLTQNSFLNRYFGGYHLTYLNLSNIHEIDSPAGAFFLIPKKVFDKIKGFDENFFMYGEDLDLSYRIKKSGYKIIYYPKYEIIHYKHQSGLKSDQQTQKITKKYFYDAMKIFYKKHYSNKYPRLFNQIIYKLIDIKSGI